jgi:lipopolysaccharide biosynthesis glycosyltransferase
MSSFAFYIIHLESDVKLLILKDEEDLEEIKSIRELAESFQKKLSDEVIKMLNNKIDNVINKY